MCLFFFFFSFWQREDSSEESSQIGPNLFGHYEHDVPSFYGKNKRSHLVNLFIATQQLDWALDYDKDRNESANMTSE